MAKRISLLIVVGLLALPACRGQSATSPTPPPPVTNPAPVADPLVTIQVTYDCHPCFDDPDHFSILIDCGRPGDCTAFVHPTNHLLEHNVMTFNGRLAPGSHTFEVSVGPRAVAPVLISFLSGGPPNTGGIKPDSLRVLSSETGQVDILAFSRCGLVNTFSVSTAGSFGSVFGFDVMLGSGSSVC